MPRDLDSKKMALIDTVIILSGLVLVLAMQAPVPSMLSNLFGAVGTGLIAAGFVSLLIRRFYTKTTDGLVELAAAERIDLARYYTERRRKVTSVHKLVSIAATGALKHLSTDDEFLDKVLRKKIHVKLLFLSPSSNYVEQRAREDRVELAKVIGDLRDSVRYSVEVGNKLLRRYEELKKSGTLDDAREGSIEIRVMDGCPYCTIYQVDDEILWGLYSSACRGLNSAALRVKDPKGELANQLDKHFEALWEMSRENYLVRYVQQGTPAINKSFADNLTQEASTQNGSA